MKVRNGWIALTMAMLSTFATIGALLNTATAASACPVETVRARAGEPSAQQLPDCRAYEQVSPVEKNTTDAMGRPGFVQSSPSGENVTYYSVVPFPDIAGSSEFPSYFSMRNSVSWATQGLLPLVEPDANGEVKSLTDAGDETIVSVGREAGLLLASGAKAGEGNLYIHNNVAGEYKLIAAGVGAVTVADATPDGSRVLFTGIIEEGQELAGVTDPTEVPYLFEWDRETGQVSVVGVVGGKTPEGGVLAGSNENGGENTYGQNTISTDGLRIFFSERTGGEKVYMGEPDTERTVEVSAGAAQWKAATPEGSKAFYIEGMNLYKFEVEGSKRTAITSGAANVLGLVGISADGSYAYFVAEGVIPGENEANAEAGAANLYEWHEGVATPIRFIAKLDHFFDESDWQGFAHDEPGGPAQGFAGSRVSRDGTKVLVSSRAKLTGYNNAGMDEIYLYSATEPVSPSNPRCVSCNPTGAAAKEDAVLSRNNINSAPAHLSAFMTRNLSADGRRVFFQTEEKLLSQANGQMNVYEWEQEGSGSCGVGEGDGSGGCLFLISTGQSTSASYFGDASESGSNVFFFTRQSLVAQDQDSNIDVYDARENGGLVSQNMTSAEPCGGEGCRGSFGSPPPLGVPSSTELAGIGNLAPPIESTKAKGQPKSLTRTQKLEKALKACVKRPTKQRSRCRVEARKKYGTKANKSRRGEK